MNKVTKEYYIWLWEDGRKWCQVVATNDIKSMTASYKKLYNRVMIEERK